MNTALFSELNWLAVAVAALAYFMLGALWYSALFGKRWIAYHGIDVNAADAKKGVGAIMFSSFLLMFLSVICIAILVQIIGLNGALPGIKLGLLTGIGFSAASLSITYLYLKKPLGLYLIDGLYHIVGQVIAAVILSVWK